MADPISLTSDNLKAALKAKRLLTLLNSSSPIAVMCEDAEGQIVFPIASGDDAHTAMVTFATKVLTDLGIDPGV